MKKPKGDHWSRHTHFFELDEYERSRCGAVFAQRKRWCPNCGAALDSVEDNQEWLDEAEELHWMLDK